MLDGDEAATENYNPFSPVPEPEQDKEALVRSLELAQKWTLLFVVCNSADERNRLMDEVTVRLSGKKIQRLPVAQEVGSLADVMREHLTTPPPDILFIYGIERWLSGAVNPRSIPFLLNLNAARDVFPEILHGPMVVWLPQFALEAIANAAPDFFSVRSGVYNFPVRPDERVSMMETVHQVRQSDLLGLPQEERAQKVLAMESLLSELQPADVTDPLEEAKPLNQLGLALQTPGKVIRTESCKS